MTEDQRTLLEKGCAQLESGAVLVSGPEYNEEFAAAIRALLAERDALAANDPFAGMWRELSEYQPQADRDGHGASWRTMCTQRTQGAMREAAAAAWSPSAPARCWAAVAVWAAWSAWSAAALAKGAARSIDAIRKAKEVQP
jgi:hypothetical protein